MLRDAQHDLENNGIFGAFCERHPTGVQWGQGGGCPIVAWLLLLLVRSLAELGMTPPFVPPFSNAENRGKGLVVGWEPTRGEDGKIPVLVKPFKFLDECCFKRFFPAG